MRPLPVAVQVVLVLRTLVSCGGDDAPEPDSGMDAGGCSTPDSDGDGEASATCGGTDCDDGDADRHRGASDAVGDGVDQDCDGADGADADGDGRASVASGGDDCDDGDAEVAPGRTDRAGDGVDQNCDDTDGVDADGDGHASEASGGDDCGDDDPLRNPDVPELRTWEPPLDVATGIFTWFIAVAAGRDDAAHIVFRAGDGSAGRLSHVSNRSGAWETEEVDPGPDTAYGVSVAVDAGGAAHVAYFDREGFDLRYATNASGGWEDEVIDGGNQAAIVGAFPSIAVDSEGVVYIAYGARRGLSFATGNAGSWETTTIDAGEGAADGTAAGWISLALDGEGRPHVAYTTLRTLRYASRTGNDWELVDVSDLGLQELYGVSATVDGAGFEHVGAVQVGDTVEDMDVLYSTNESGAFVQERIDSGSSAALVEGPAGEIHVAYARSGELRHSTNATGAWLGEDVAGAVVGEVAMARGTSMLHVVYAAEGATLRYTRVSLPDGIDQNCDGDSF